MIRRQKNEGSFDLGNLYLLQKMQYSSHPDENKKDCPNLYYKSEKIRQ